jgi:hypothetical protein
MTIDTSKGIPYSAARLPGESFEDYKARRKILNKVDRFILAGRPGYVAPKQRERSIKELEEIGELLNADRKLSE